MPISLTEISFPKDREKTTQETPQKTEATPAASSETGASASQVELTAVLDLVDALQYPPPFVTPEYHGIIFRVVQFLSIRTGEVQDFFDNGSAQNSWKENEFPEKESGTPSNSRKPVSYGNLPDSLEKIQNQTARARNQIFDLISKVNSFVARAKNAGFAPSENPFVLAMSYNIGREAYSPVTIPAEVAKRIFDNAQKYVRLLQAESSGELNLQENAFKAAQLSSAKFSLDGFGGSGDAAGDLARLLPDADAIKAQKASEALSVFDFTRRVPRVLFTAFYSPAGVPKGTIVGWKKLQDASGYVIRRKNIIDGREVEYTITNDDLKNSVERLREYVKAWVLSFYDNIQESTVCTFLDADVGPDAYYNYTVQAYQLQNENPGSMFSVETSPLYLSPVQKMQIKKQVLALEGVVNPGKTDLPLTIDTISPYPVLAHQLLGDSKYDWLLAAVNIRQSINRRDSRTETRKFSYLTAQTDFLFAQADAGRFVVPKGMNVSTVISNVESAISRFGVGQVLREILQETGALYHFEGKDPNDNDLFRNVDTVNQGDSNLVSIVAAAVDPETATLDLKSLASNMPQLLSGQFVDLKQNLGSSAVKTIKPTEVAVPSEFDSPSASQSEDEIQYLRQLDRLDSNIVDLTTTDGLSTFLRVIRIFSDIGPSRGAPIFQNPDAPVADPVKNLVNWGRSSDQPIEPPSLKDLGQSQTVEQKKAKQKEEDDKPPPFPEGMY